MITPLHIFIYLPLPSSTPCLYIHRPGSAAIANRCSVSLNQTPLTKPSYNQSCSSDTSLHFFFRQSYFAETVVYKLRQPGHCFYLPHASHTGLREGQLLDMRVVLSLTNKKFRRWPHGLILSIKFI